MLSVRSYFEGNWVFAAELESAKYLGSGTNGQSSFRGLIADHNLYRADDLVPEESELVQKAIKRLPAKEAYDRVFRLRRAFQVGAPSL
jgi:Ubiquinol-cytochrome C reductase complex 14kD subunit